MDNAEELLQTFRYHHQRRGILTDTQRLSEYVCSLCHGYVPKNHIKKLPKLVQAAALFLLRAGPLELTASHITHTFPAHSVVTVSWFVRSAVDDNADGED